MKWIEALKQWNAGKSGWCIPRKGTKEHAEVKALMGAAAPKAAKAVRKPAEPKEPPAPARKLPEKTIAQLRKVEQDTKNRNTGRRAVAQLRKVEAAMAAKKAPKKVPKIKVKKRFIRVVDEETGEEMIVEQKR
jgi:hypothetical protein